jgi:hypothetical protein
MGKRTRRQNPRTEPATAPAGESSARRKKRQLKARASAASAQAEKTIKDRPAAPWDPFPLMELAIFCGLVLMVVGVILGGQTGLGLMASGFVLVCIGGLDTMLREHFAGYRSHAGVLAGVCALAALIASTAIFSIDVAIRAAIAIGVFAVIYPTLRREFVRRSGGKGVL